MTGKEIKEQVYDAVACDDMFYRPELRDAIYDMVDKNAKLREYVAAIAHVAYNGQMSCTNGLYECEFFNQCYNNEPTKHDGRGCKWVIWARELGIEVKD